MQQKAVTIGIVGKCQFDRKVMQKNGPIYEWCSVSNTHLYMNDSVQK